MSRMPKRLPFKNLLRSGSHASTLEETEADESVTGVFRSAQAFSISSSQAPKIIRGITSDAPKTATSTQLPRSSCSSQTKVSRSSHSSALPQTQVPLSSHSSAPPQTQVPLSSRFSAPPQTQVPRSSHSTAPPQTQVPRSSHSSAPPQTQVPLSSRFSAPPQTQVPRSSHSTAPAQSQVPRSSHFSALQHTNVPRSSPSFAPPSTQIPRSFPPSVQSPSSSSTSAANSDPESSKYRQEVSVPPPTQPTSTPATSNLDPAVIIRNSLRAWTGLSPFGNAAGLLGATCGLIATDYNYFPISFKSWGDVPDSYFDNAWNNMFEPKFYFKTHEDIAKRFVNQSMNEKWKARRYKLWREFYDPTSSRNDLISNLPDGVPRDQWATFVDYRLNADTQKMCAQNKENSRCTVPSACGAKSLMRRKKEMEVELKGASVYEVGESSGSSKVVLETLDGALKEVAILKSIIKKLVPAAEFEKAFREKIQEEDDDSSDGSNGA
ncbi:hypothetical protein ACFE04_031562 [Oxalis oulophora]